MGKRRNAEKSLERPEATRRDLKLTERERHRIIKLYDQCYTVRQIAEETQRPLTAVRRVLLEATPWI